MELDQLLRLMADRGASDLHLKPMRPPLLRVNGKLMPIDSDPLTPDQIESMVQSILSPAQKARLDEHLAVDIGHGVHGLARFRGSVFIQRGTLTATFRRIPIEVQELEELGLPDVLMELCDLPMGLVLITGPTGSGKSTTLAAMINRIARRRSAHVITIEDPIEFLFLDDVASISQREVGTDTPSFGRALRDVVRQDPDVIMVGEMRDQETISTVITAAETGHLVFSTLHTNSATQSIDRILDSAPVNQQKQLRVQLEQVLKGVVSMMLVERADGKGLVPALEIMRATPRVAELILKGDTAALQEEVENSVSYYRMQSMNQSLIALLVHGTILYAEAMRQSPDPEDLSLKLRKMFPTIEEQGEDMSSTADYSQILELQQFRKLYEEQEERHKIHLTEMEARTGELQAALQERERQLQEMKQSDAARASELDKALNEVQRVEREAQDKIDKLTERIKELNQRLVSGAR
ncbi:MAG: PilT/PilU family type 4a pilus ATPase [Acidobacteria bacterium]|nr:PilT/PilU family type 4a pilus ATPase [Acidobacteriota bacterium]